MFFVLPLALLLSIVSRTTDALPYDPAQVDFNLNQNETATSPLDYWGSWDDHVYQASPTNWRFPFYTIFLDRFVNGDPSNDNANGSVYEHDIISNQFRNGGDVKGLQDSLDYLQGMGIKGLYLAGSPHINQPWAADSYSPLDLTLLDYHFGNITAWREAIAAIHAKGMYVVLDNTMSTLGDLIGFDGYLNASTPFTYQEHDALWKSDRRYWDFDVENEWQDACDVDYPRFWGDTGEMVGRNVTDLMTGCMKSDFDQYGDVASFGDYPEYEKQITKFGSVQDRLREWRPSVLDRIKRFSCITIHMLDIDGFRIDKALTITVDAQAEWSDHMRQCAASVNKSNFFIPGEIVSGNVFASLYLGRGKEPQMGLQTPVDGLAATAADNEELYIRNSSRAALDAAAFHYSIYRSMTRFLGIDGIYAALNDIAVNWVDGWNEIVQTNDLFNHNTGQFDPRHMYGVTNQDVFRWPAIVHGTEKNLLGLFVTTIILPGIPTLMWGEEQAFYVLENTANNYIFGRSPMTSSLAWQVHGCYNVGVAKYSNFPMEAAFNGCHDDTISLDHRDPSHPVRNVLKRMYELRTIYPVLNDGFNLTSLSKQTYNIFLPGSGGTATETGMWSTLRSRAVTQDLTTEGGQGNQSVWLVYGNDNRTVTYSFNCRDPKKALIAPFDTGTTVKNLFYPYEEVTLEASPVTMGFEGSTTPNGCTSQLTLPGWGFKAYVPVANWVGATPVITTFSPGHDFRLQSTVEAGKTETVAVSLSFSTQMDCQSVTNSISVLSDTADGSHPTIGSSSCESQAAVNVSNLAGSFPSQWTWSANLSGVANGVHQIVVNNCSSSSGNYTNAIDRFLFRIGSTENPMVFPHTANYSASLLMENSDGSVYINHKAAGATKYRYSRDFESTYSDWMPYSGGNTTLAASNWTGTKDQGWKGEHVYVQYWSALTASSDHYQIGDLGVDVLRRWPHMYVQGPFNQYSYDTGLSGSMTQNPNGTWEYDFMYEWPTSFQLNEWGSNPDGRPDQTLILGDVDGDMVLDRLPPGSLIQNIINITDSPASPHTGWKILVDDGSYIYSLIPIGNRWNQLAVFVLLWIIPVLTAAGTIYIFMKAFYQIKFNQLGISNKQAIIPLAVRRKFKKATLNEKPLVSTLDVTKTADLEPPLNPLQADAGGVRRSVLIATMEYDIQDWAIKIKIGGLGVMAQLMGTNLGHQDLIWVVPCVDGIEYPIDTPVESMYITILDKEYEIQVQQHVLRNITYVLLDAPIFRKQSKNEPYPARMDDLESAIYYSAWNQCIAQAIERFNVSLYHINDYHGALAPLHLLPRVIPCCLSLHNAEFQGLWPMRTPKERDEVCAVFNLDVGIAQKYVQFGEVFNLLHAGASYLRIHQKGFGAVGVSKKYGKRTFARYPIFWGLSKIGSLPNPDPTDTGEWERNAASDSKDEVTVDEDFEAKRPALKRQAQEWAGLDIKPDAQLFVFVGRWSMQKGIDLIADVFPSILEQYPTVQLITVGPVIDLYGRFAALKLEKMMSLYPGRVYSKPEFTALPPYIFSGSEFALIPSRDEPFGLVAVEFGRKGALGVGAKVGGLGQMPGWWYSIESMTPKHLVHQFKMAINEALASSEQTRQMMRARSALQRFPVAQWVEDLDTLQTTAIKLSREEDSGGKLRSPSMANLRTLFVGGHHEHDPATPTRPSTPGRHGSSLIVPGTPGSASGHWTPPVMSMPSPGLNAVRDSVHTPTSPSITSPHDDDILLPPSIFTPSGPRGSMSSRRFSTLSYDSVAGERKDFALQKVDPSFTDSQGIYLRAFEKKLEHLGAKSSENLLCIEENLIKSEKDYFNAFRDAKMGYSTASNSRANSPAPSRNGSRPVTPVGSFFDHSAHDSVGSNGSQELLNNDEFALGKDYRPPTGLRRFMLYKIGDWPIYSIVLAFGQIIAANSYQITLLIGEVGETAEQLYIIASIYAASSMLWWLVFRRLKSVWVLSLPFAFYGLAFFLIGMAPFAASHPRGWIQNVATGVYAVASSSGSLFFALNFGDEGGAPIKSWVLRACLVQGTQQIYISALWYWGSSLVMLNSSGVAITATTVSNAVITSVTVPIAVLMWTLGCALFFGLPKYYRSSPGTVPSFYKSVFNRKIILWFFVSVIVQNYWLSAPYGRNWRYLWTTQHAPVWAIVLLVILFFIVIWVLILIFLSRLSKSHSWILPVFAIGLGAPRWCQMLWATSGIGSALPWAGSAVASAVLGRCLWLWLGVLDALQGVGFGMILLQTMTRFHICFTLIAAQVLGSFFTILARLTAPDKTGPGNVFPNFAFGSSGLNTVSFWFGLLMQLMICVGFALFFRKEQLSKP
ncbi:MAG: hypothetical protein M1818_000991 [Claussenomyces sp. TS43310]|nr:MAG: hypothetical protein M1818_000991 [Claussenomyces sp. TS43310]